LVIIDNGKLKELREDKDYTQKHVALILNISQQQYQRYESNSYPLPLNYLKIICLLYNVSADYILGLPKDLRWPR